jgi:hypothetical protein
VPREKKGISPQIEKSPERIPLEDALDKLVGLFADWNLNKEDYVLVDEFAYLLQGYEVRGTEVESGHLDVYVNPKKLPWKDKKERSIIPPKDSSEIVSWASYMEKTGYGLDMLRAKGNILQTPTLDYVLPSGKSIRLMKAYEMTEAFVEQTLMYYSLKDVGEEKIREWITKLKLIQKAAEKKNDSKTVKFCKDKLIECQEKWRDVL